MSDARNTRTPTKPWHLWLIGIAGTLWSAMGAISFVLTQLKVEAVMSRFPAEQRAYFESFPWWNVACWAIGVFGGVLGCVMLLRRHRLAFPVLLASAFGTIVSTLGGLFLLGGMDVMRATDGLGLSVVPVIVTALLAVYARAMQTRSVEG